MAIAVNALLTWTRMANARRAAVVSELMPGGLNDLDQCLQEETREAIKGFKTLPTAADRFSLSALTTKRIVQLALWVKDRVRLGQPVEFENGTTQVTFASEIEQAQQREQIRQDRKKTADGLSTLKIDPPLKNSAGSSKSQRHVHKERDQKRRRVDQGNTREVAATAALEQATAVIANVTFEEPPENDNGGAGRAAGFGRGACCDRGRGHGQASH
jgi:hypothetical protein